ncbi:MAG: hypothetical protein A3G66_01470 [Candidatus Levybacteria bacterium RIFCSPLOWO2_12_FULL_39_17]|nr:MAG: hypothetical protein A3G66_01470 [Candidatus Levybacteria bacterium RIFCSPLOWO2_12_FULL_39_17]
MSIEITEATQKFRRSLLFYFILLTILNITFYVFKVFPEFSTLKGLLINESVILLLGYLFYLFFKKWGLKRYLTSIKKPRKNR